MAEATGNESADTCRLRRRPALRGHSAAGRSTARWISSSTGRARRCQARGQRAIVALEKFAETMGPADGRSEILVSRKMTSPLFAALVNAAASHISEQDDVHNGSVFHPAAVVFPAALATAQHLGASGRDFIAASVAGYEVGIRVGEFLGRSHYKVFHTTGTAGTIAAAVAVGRLLGLDPTAMLHAIGSAGTQAAGLWEFLRDAADSKQLHTAKAAADGLTAAFLAQGRLHRREAHPRRQAGHGRRHVHRCRSGETRRPPRHALGGARDLLQVPRLLPPHPSGCRRAAQGDRRQTIWRRQTSPA